MQHTIRRTIALWTAAVFLLGFGTACGTDPSEQAAQTPTPAAQIISSAAPIEDTVVSAKETETPAADDIIATPTPTSTPEPTDTPTPTPTATPVPNPYVGVWTIEDMPFSLELRDDNTYLITVSDREREGAYTFGTNSVTLTGANGDSVELHYYSKADTLKIDDFKLIRDDLVFFYDISSIPVSFQNENDDVAVTVRGSVVEAEAKNGKQIRSYCFTGAGLTPPEQSRDWFDTDDRGEDLNRVRVFKYDGAYTLWTIDTDGEPLTPIEVTVASGTRYTIGSEGIDFLRKPLRAFLRERDTGTDELNRSMCREVLAAGLYTRAGAVTAGVSLVSALSKYGYSVGRQENGTYQAAQEWGVNPMWGYELSAPEADEDEEEEEAAEEESDLIVTSEFYAGLGSAASIIWAYRQAGLNLCADVYTPITALGEREDVHDNRIDADRAESGDILENDGEYSMVVDRLDQNGDGADDAYLLYEMGKELLTVQILPFKQAQAWTAYSMDAFFDGRGRNVDRIIYWENTFKIPKEELPLYVLETIDSEETQLNFMQLIGKLGF